MFRIKQFLRVKIRLHFLQCVQQSVYLPKKAPDTQKNQSLNCCIRYICIQTYNTLKAITCKNCDTTFEGKFCPQCGQKGSAKRFKTKDLLSDLLKKEFHWDKGLLLTTRHLILRPGPTIKGYLSGKRVQYTKPLSYLFLVVALSLLVYTKEDLFERNPLAIQSKAKPEVQSAVADWAFGHLSLLILGMIPFMSLASKWLYKKAKLHYAEHFVMNTYAMSGITLLGMVVSGSAKLLGYDVKGGASMAVSFALSMLYIAWIYVEVFDNRHRWYGGIKAALALSLGYVFYILFAMIAGVIGVLVYLLLIKPML